MPLRQLAGRWRYELPCFFTLTWADQPRIIRC